MKTRVLVFAFFLTSLFSGCATNNGALEETNTQVTSLSKRLSAQESKLTAVETSIDKRIEQRIDPVSETVRKLRAQLALNSAQLDEFETAVNDVSEGNKATLEAVIKFLDGRRKALIYQQKQVDALLKKLAD